MSKEYQPHNPENFTPDQFMQAPTRDAWPELTNINRQLAQAIEGIWRQDKNTLLIGTELEVLFFKKDVDPFKANRRYWAGSDSKLNPNYKQDHRKTVRDLSREADGLRYEYPENFWKCNRESILLIEFRTAPAPLQNHVDNVTFLADWIRNKSAEHQILPVLHSQHIHMSLNRKTFEIGKDTRIHHQIRCSQFSDFTVESAFSRVLPLVILPEEYDKKTYDLSWAAHKKGGRGNVCEHPEFRLLSSEYANDHILNLTLSLRCMYAMLINPEFVSHRKFIEESYTDEVTQMAKNPELINFFGGSTLEKLSQVIAQYPAVSRREIRARDIK
jgi:hypothetical protein